MRRCATKRRTSRYSLCRFQFRDKAPATPKLNVIAVDELPSVFECGVVIRGIEPMHSVATGRVGRLGGRVAVAHMELVNDTDEQIAAGSAAYIAG